MKQKNWKMKTIDQIRDSISSIQMEHKNKNEFTPRQYKKAGDKVNFLTLCVYYLETGPNIEFIIQQRDDCERKIQITKTIIGEKRPKLLKSELKPFIEQLKMLNYLLSKH